MAAGCGAIGAQPTPTIIAPISLPTATASPVQGQLLITRSGNFFTFDLGTLRESQISHFPKDTFAASPALSPDGEQVAYTDYVLPKDQSDLGGSDLMVMGASGDAPRLIRAHGKPGTSFEEPCWAADGSAILATSRQTVYANGKFQGVKITIVRAPLAGSNPATIVEDAQTPAASPDGKYLAYLTTDQQGVTRKLWIADAQGRGGRELLADKGFTYVRAPHFSRDGSYLAFGGVGGPPDAGPAQARQARPAEGLLGVGRAEAHGIPWEIWVVRPDGSDLRRLTHLQEDSPVPTWSPDGRWIAFSAEVGLYLVDAHGHQTLRLSTQPSGGGLAWLTR